MLSDYHDNVLHEQKLNQRSVTPSIYDRSKLFTASSSRYSPALENYLDKDKINSLLKKKKILESELTHLKIKSVRECLISDMIRFKRDRETRLKAKNEARPSCQPYQIQLTLKIKDSSFSGDSFKEDKSLSLQHSLSVNKRT